LRRSEIFHELRMKFVLPLCWMSRVEVNKDVKTRAYAVEGTDQVGGPAAR
jgi:hypothetical protein